MNRSTYCPGIRAGAAAACLAAAGMILAACGTSSPSGNASSNSPAVPSATTSSGSTTQTSALSVPFPLAVGSTWVYRQLIGGIVLQKNKITAIVPTAGGQQVYMGHTYYIFHSDGSITLPLNQFKSSGAVIKVIRGSLEWPPASVIASGQPTSSTVTMSASVAGHALDATAHVTVRGDGTQTVTVPAGTYSATVVDMTEALTIFGHTGTIEIKTWVASGVGPVQTEVLSGLAGAQSLASKTVLVSFTRG
jgi:hypothetical protein